MTCWSCRPKLTYPNTHAAGPMTSLGTQPFVWTASRAIIWQVLQRSTWNWSKRDALRMCQWTLQQSSSLPLMEGFVKASQLRVEWRSGLIPWLSCHILQPSCYSYFRRGWWSVGSIVYPKLNLQFNWYSCTQHPPYLYDRIVCWLLLQWWVLDHSLWAACTCLQKHGRAGSMET